MCTALTYQTKDFYFGRNLDYERSYVESVTVTPRGFSFSHDRIQLPHTCYAMIGMAYVKDGYPLYYDATNECGLSMAGLSFPEDAVYLKPEPERNHVPPYALIPYVLGQCKTLTEAKACLAGICVTDVPFSEELPLTPLHWLVADKTGAVTVEPTKDGLRLYDNPVGVLTNSPPFPMQMFALNDYPFVTAEPPNTTFCDKIPLRQYSRGLGGLGIPGDLSSKSRFIRGAFCKLNAVSGESESESVNQFFHMLGAVAQQRGLARLKADEYELTIYSSCCNADKGIYYYTTYENSQITAVDMHREELDGEVLVVYPLNKKWNPRWENQ